MPAIAERRYPEGPSLVAGAWAAGLFGIALLVLFHQTAWSMVSIWLRSETFAHGFLILPISLWLIWRERQELAALKPRPAPWVAVLLLVPGLVWLVAWTVDVLVVQQLALVAMLVLGVWAILGHQLARALAFPLLFLFLAVPMGDSLVQPMMEFTATTTVWLVQQTGVPVYREGMYFSLPSGTWSVVEACSGVRYIIASFTLGVLYAYLTYRTRWRRVAFVLASLVVPVIANTIRAYIIVMLGHWSDMKIATGVDHLIYGWVFFGLVMFLLFWVGAMFREDHDTPAAPAPISEPPSRGPSIGLPALAVVALLVLAVPAALLLLTAAGPVADGADVATPRLAQLGAAGATGATAEPAWEWRPAAMVVGQSSAYYSVDGNIVGLYLQYDDGSLEGGEVVGSSMRFARPKTTAREMGLDRVEIQFKGRMPLVDQAEVFDPAGPILAWSWYRIGDVDTSSDYLAKFIQAWLRLKTGVDASSRVVLAVAMPDSVQASQAVLQAFLDQYGAELDAALTPAGVGVR